jgi:hypothetical protein
MLINHVSAFTNQDVKVGIFVYTWYNPADPISWAYPKIVDKPLLDFYNSSDPIVIATQIKEIADLGIDFVMLSYWGACSPPEFSNVTITNWYDVAKTNASNLKLSIMVEPFNESGTYDYTAIYDWAFNLYNNTKGSSLIETVTGSLLAKPIIFFYNGQVLTNNGDFPKDDRFIVMTVGHSEYVDFWYDDIRNYIPTHERDQISVLPRFDDYWQFELGLRDHVNIIDRYYTEGLYQSQWERAIKRANEHSVRWITIATWNEYPERTEIEPHYDNTAWNKDPYYLYNMTRDYINQLHGLTAFADSKASYWYQDPLIFGLITLGLVVGGALIWERR